MIRKILKSPAADVRQVCTPVTVFDESLRRLAQDLIDTLKASKRAGVGLSANQIGDLRRVFVVDMSQRGDPQPAKVYVNPRLTKFRGEQRGIEGCLSLEPEDDCMVTRYKIINFAALDLNGQPITGKLSGFDARVFQHELDHLNGILIVDRKGKR